MWRSYQGFGRLGRRHLVRRVRADSGVPLGQLAVLGLLDREGPHTTADLAGAQLVRHQSMARTVAQLVERGLVEQAAHPSDGRKTQLTITPAGCAALEHERERRVDWLADVIAARLSADERRALAGTVELLARLADR